MSADDQLKARAEIFAEFHDIGGAVTARPPAPQEPTAAPPPRPEPSAAAPAVSARLTAVATATDRDSRIAALAELQGLLQ